MAADILDKVRKKTYTLEENFELEEKAVYISEFQNGKIVPCSWQAMLAQRNEV